MGIKIGYILILEVVQQIGLTSYSILRIRQLPDVLLPQPRLSSLVVRIVSDSLAGRVLIPP